MLSHCCSHYRTLQLCDRQWMAACATVCGSENGSVQQCMGVRGSAWSAAVRQCAAVMSAAVCGSVWQCDAAVRQCDASVRQCAAVCGSARSSM